MKATKCSKCGEKVVLRKIPEYHFDTVGLPNVWLIGISGYGCASCGNKSVLLPAYGQLMSTIAEAVVYKNDSYASHEIYFLRKFFGITGKVLATRLGTNQKTVSFWQSGKSEPSPAYGIKLRRLFIEEFLKYLEDKKETHKKLLKKTETMLRIVRQSLTDRDFIKALAQRAAKEKMKEAELLSFAQDSAPTFRIPDSKSFVQLRLH